MSKKGKNDEIYTPERVVNYILDAAEYMPSSAILGKHVMDNSCGNGQILVEVVKRYTQAYIDIHGNYDGLSEDLYKHIHGIEIKQDACDECRKRITEAVLSHGVELDPGRLDIVCANAFTARARYAKSMDYVFGNPPYVRYRALKADEKELVSKFPLCGKGLVDVYIAFFNLGIEMLRDDSSILSYITPSSWTNSASGLLFRLYVRNHDLLKSLFDFEHEQVFDGVTTYSMITVLEGKSRKVFDYYRFDGERGEFEYVDRLRYNDAFIGNSLYLGTMDDLDFVRQVLTGVNDRKCYVRNGIVTLSDTIFIDNLPADIGDSLTIKVIKASNGRECRCMFPYSVEHGNGPKFQLLPLGDIREANPKLYKYIVGNEPGLRARTYQPHGADLWYGIGRSQGLKDLYAVKYAVPNLVRHEDDVKIFPAEGGVGVYGGVYVVGNPDTVRVKLVDEKENFFKFVRCLKHYKSGGYYTFTSIELEKYLNYEY